MPPLPRVPYLTDNPFRLLGVGSSTPLSLLRQQARAAERSLQVGLPTSVSLPEFLGDEDLGGCSNQIRALGTDPRRLLLFRIFWPLDGPAVESEPDDAAGDGEVARVWQQDFLRDWLAFLAAPDPQTLDDALLSYDFIDANEYLSTVLFDLLVADRFYQPDLDLLLVVAWREARLTVWGLAARVAAEQWHAGASDRAVELIQALSVSVTTDEVLSEALTVFVPVGEALSRELCALAAPTSAELLVHGLTMPECAARLQLLVQHLKPHLSQAGLWNSAWSRYVVDAGSAAHDAALHLAETTHAYSAAATLLTQLLAWPISQTWQAEVERDLARMRAALSPPGVELPAPSPVSEKRPRKPLIRHWSAVWNVALVLFLIVVIGTAYRHQTEEAARIPPSYSTEPAAAPDSEPAAKPAKPVAPEKPEPGPLPEEVSHPEAVTAADPEPPASTSPESEAVNVTAESEVRSEEGSTPAAAAQDNSLPTAPSSENYALKQELEGMKRVIQTGKTRLTLAKVRLERDDADIDQEQALLDGLSSSIREAKAKLDKYEQDSRSGLEVDQDAYQRVLDAHNDLVDRHNRRLPGLRRLIARRNELLDQYNEILKEHNRLVDDYNQKLTTLTGG